MVSKFAPKRKNQLIHKNDIGEEIRQIEETDYYVSYAGNVYRKYTDDLYYKRKPYLNKRNGYYYITLITNSAHITFRLHRIIAKAWIENPNNLPIVGHKDNNKQNYNASNLYWTTLSENSQKAVDDGLLTNDKGYNDSQSNHVIVYDKDFNEIDRIGSFRECSKKYNVSVSTVARHCYGKIKTKTRCGLYFRIDKEMPA